MSSSDRNYTVLNLPWVNACIEKHLNLIVESLQREISQIDAVVLVGGFGRGEGSVLIEQEQVIPLNDYDFVLAMRSEWDQTQLSRLGNHLSAQIGIRHIDFIPIPTTSFKTLPPSQFNYDMKHGGKVLAGADVLTSIPEIPPSAIPVSDARRLLINRAVCLLEGFPDGQTEVRFPFDGQLFAFYQTAKAVLACGEALLIQSGYYHHSYVARQEIIRELFSSRSNFVYWHGFATDFKLRPLREPKGNIKVFWYNALLEYIRTICELVLGLREGDPTEETLLDCIAYLTSNEEIDLIERVELEIIFARYLGPRRGRSLLARAARDLHGIKGLLRTWNQIRRDVIKKWHIAHP